MKRARIEGRGAPIERDPEEDDGQQPEEATRNDEKSNERSRFDKVHEAAGDTLDSPSITILPSSIADETGVRASSVPSRPVLFPPAPPEALPPEALSAPTAISNDTCGAAVLVSDPRQWANQLPNKPFAARASTASDIRIDEPLWAVQFRGAPCVQHFPPSSWPTRSLLDDGFCFNKKTLQTGLRTAVCALATYHGAMRDEAVVVPLTIAVGVAGQGKTGLLRLIRGDRSPQGRGAAKVTESDPSKDVPMDHCHAPTMDPGLPQNAATRWLEDIRLSYNEGLSNFGRSATPLSVSESDPASAFEELTQQVNSPHSVQSESPDPKASRSRDWVPSIDDFYNDSLPDPPADTAPVKVQRAVAVLATFGQGQTAWDSKEDSVHGLSARLIVDYFEPQYVQLGYEDAVDAIRAAEARSHDLDPKEVLVVVLVDEIRAIDDNEKRNYLLQVLCEVQKFQLEKSLPFFSVVTWPDTPFDDAVCAGVRLPLSRISLFPVSRDDRFAFFRRCIAETESLLGSPLTKDARYLLQFHISSAVGHLRSLQEIWNNLTNLHGIRYPSEPQYLPHLLDLLSRTILNRKMWMNEGELLGGAYLRKEGDGFATGKTVSQLAWMKCGISYSRTEESGELVKPAFFPLSLKHTVLEFRLNAKTHHQVLSQIVLALKRLLRTLFVEFAEQLIKSWERMIPLLEVVTAALIRPHHSLPCAFTKIYPRKGCVFIPWRGERLSSVVASDAAEQCHLRQRINWPREKGEIQKSTAILKNLISDADKAVYIALPAVQNYPAIEGVCNHFELQTVDSEGKPVRKTLHMVIQMKLGEERDPSALQQWLALMHRHAQNELGLTKGQYYCVLYCSQHHATASKTVEKLQLAKGIHPGTIVVCVEALSHLLEPFGTSPLMQLLKEKAKEQAGKEATTGMGAVGTEVEVDAQEVEAYHPEVEMDAQEVEVNDQEVEVVEVDDEVVDVDDEVVDVDDEVVEVDDEVVEVDDEVVEVDDEVVEVDDEGVGRRDRNQTDQGHGANRSGSPQTGLDLTDQAAMPRIPPRIQNEEEEEEPTYFFEDDEGPHSFNDSDLEEGSAER